MTLSCISACNEGGLAAVICHPQIDSDSEEAHIPSCRSPGRRKDISPFFRLKYGFEPVNPKPEHFKKTPLRRAKHHQYYDQSDKPQANINHFFTDKRLNFLFHLSSSFGFL
jgi:hypothetical protein